MNLIFDHISPLEALGLTIIGEARGEPIEGQVAVGSVIRNRLHSKPEKYRNYKDVCFEDAQFSCWNVADPNYSLLLDLAAKIVNSQSISDPYLRQCLWVAQGVDNWDIQDNTHGALNYLTKNLYDISPPKWARNPKRVTTVGRQVFLVV